MSSRKTILIVDDIPLMRTILGRYVKSIASKILVEEGGATGVDVVEAHCGEAALERLRREDVDVVFLDLMMPGMDGLTLLSIKQKDPDISSVPVVVCSARGEKELIARAHDLGALAYIVKPFTLQSVEEKFRQALAAPRE